MGTVNGSFLIPNLVEIIIKAIFRICVCHKKATLILYS